MVKRKSSISAAGKVNNILTKYKNHTLHSGSKKGPVVQSKKQALAIALSETRRPRKKR